MMDQEAVNAAVRALVTDEESFKKLMIAVISALEPPLVSGILEGKISPFAMLTQRAVGNQYVELQLLFRGVITPRKYVMPSGHEFTLGERHHCDEPECPSRIPG